MSFKKIIVKKDGERLDTFLTEKLGLSRSAIQKLIANGDIRLNDAKPKKTGAKLTTGDKIAYRIPEAKQSKAQAEDIPLNILFENKDFLVINKQAGIVVHPDQSGHESGTIVNAILSHCKNLSGIGGEKRPGIVHRLDKDTSGTLIIAKNDKTHAHLSKLFKDREVEKTYIALVKGTPKTKEGRIEAAIKRDRKSRQQMAINAQGKNAVTKFKVLESFSQVSLLEVEIETGRTHQIRLHLASIGHPVTCDNKYGDKKFNEEFQKKTGLTRQFLHAQTLKIDGKTYTSPLPQDLQVTLGQL